VPIHSSWFSSLQGRTVAALATAIIAASGITASPETLGAQQPSAPPAAVAADPKDVASQDAIVAAVYASISGAKGEKRNWDRFRSLFAPGARLIPTAATPDGTASIRTMSPEDYATSVGSRLEQGGFFEKEIARTGDTFGRITQTFSTYESRRTASDEKPFARGINSIQLFNDGKRWWVVTIYWDSERPNNPIPAKYLPR
jgi:hypothetical protein